MSFVYFLCAVFVIVKFLSISIRRLPIGSFPRSEQTIAVCVGLIVKMVDIFTMTKLFIPQLSSQGVCAHSLVIWLHNILDEKQADRVFVAFKSALNDQCASFMATYFDGPDLEKEACTTAHLPSPLCSATSFQ